MHNDLTDSFTDGRIIYQIAVISAIACIALVSITSYIGCWPALLRTT